LVLSKSRKHLTLMYQMLESAQLHYESNDLAKRRPLSYGFYWGLNPNGENGMTKYCEAIIPKIVQRKKQLKFDLSNKQKCIFSVKKSGPYHYCEYHQYLEEPRKVFIEKQSGDKKIIPGVIDYIICQNCPNYTLKCEKQLTGDQGVICQICSGSYNVSGNLNLLETLKGANVKTSNKQKHREMLNESRECDIILGTNDICSEGFSVESLNTLISLTPQQDVEQTVGRILRKQDADMVNNPLIIDLIDRCGNFVNHARVRNKTYGKEGFRIINFPALDLDDGPHERFSEDLFQHHVYQQSYGTTTENVTNTQDITTLMKIKGSERDNGEDNNDEDDDDEDNDDEDDEKNVSTPKKCLI